MVKRWLKILLVVGFISVSLFSWGADHCVRSGLTYNGDGTTWAAASGDGLTGAFNTWPASMTRGDTYYVADGTYGWTRLNDADSGTDVITIQKATASSHGTETGWDNAYGDGQATITEDVLNIIDIRNSYYVIDGQTGSGDTGSSYGFRIYHSDTTQTNGQAIYIQSQASNITIKYCEIEHHGTDAPNGSQDAVHFYEGAGHGPYDSITFTNNYVHEAPRCLLFLSSVTNSTFTDNYFARNESNASNHGQPIQMRSDNGDPTGNTFNNNFFEDGEGTAIISIRGSGHFIYNNVVWWTDSFGGEMGNGIFAGGTGVDVDTTLIYSNTFYNITGTGVDNAGIYFDSGETPTGNVAKNNIWYNVDDVSFEGVTHDYNAFETTKSESNEQLLASDPFTDSSTYDLTLTSQTLAIDNGDTLGAPYNADILGTARPQRDAYDIGAYEYDGGRNWFVDYVGGDDTNSGLDISNPFQRSPGDDNATDDAAAAVPFAGDTIVFEGGVTYEGRIDGDWSGSSGNVITYISGHVYSPAWGAGRAIVDGTGISVDAGGAFTGVFSLLGASYITVEGFQVQDGPNTSGFEGAIGWKGTSGGSIIVDNCKLTSNDSNGVMFQGLWDAGTNPTVFTVQNCEIDTNGYHGIQTRGGTDDVTIIDNEIYGNGLTVGDGIFMGGGGTAMADDIIIRGNEIYDHDTKGTMLIVGTDVLIEDNLCRETGAVQDEFGIMIGTKGTLTSSNYTIRNNIIKQDHRIEGLIRIWCDSNGIVDGVDIYNNTIWDLNTADIQPSIILHEGSSLQTDAIRNVVIKNNIITSDRGAGQYTIHVNSAECSLGFVATNNHYYNAQATGWEWEGVAQSYATWTTAGRDADSSNGVDPDLQSNGSPNGGSPVINAGIDLSGEGFSDDYIGTSRPQPVGGDWDIGAYEYYFSTAENETGVRTRRGGLIDSSWFGFFHELINKKVFWVVIIMYLMFATYTANHYIRRRFDKWQ